MWRYWVGAIGALVLIAGGIFWWRGTAVAQQRLPNPPAIDRVATSDDQLTPEPPAASEKTREEKRFSRSDHDKNGQISRDEFLAARQRNFAKLDINNDGRLTFDEYAVKGVERFAKADADRSAGLGPAEFATTRAPRKAKASCACSPARTKKDDDDE